MRSFRYVQFPILIFFFRNSRIDRQIHPLENGNLVNFGIVDGT